MQVFAKTLTQTPRNESVDSFLGKYRVDWDVVSEVTFDFSKQPDGLPPILTEFETIAINNFTWIELAIMTNSAIFPGAMNSITHPFNGVSWGIVKICHRS